MTDETMIVAYRASSDAEAAMLAQSLEAAGVRTTLTGGALAIAYGELPADSLLIDIWIPEDKAELARKTITEAQEHKPQDEEQWTCTGCSEENEGAFEVCWSCQIPRT